MGACIVDEAHDHEPFRKAMNCQHNIMIWPASVYQRQTYLLFAEDCVAMSKRAVIL